MSSVHEETYSRQYFDAHLSTTELPDTARCEQIWDGNFLARVDASCEEVKIVGSNVGERKSQGNGDSLRVKKLVDYSPKKF